MNRLVGKIGSFITGLAVFSFAISMLVSLFVKGTFASCFSSIFIAIDFIPFMIYLVMLSWVIAATPSHRAASAAKGMGSAALRPKSAGIRQA